MVFLYERRQYRFFCMCALWLITASAHGAFSDVNDTSLMVAQDPQDERTIFFSLPSSGKPSNNLMEKLNQALCMHNFHTSDRFAGIHELAGVYYGTQSPIGTSTPVVSDSDNDSPRTSPTKDFRRTHQSNNSSNNSSPRNRDINALSARLSVSPHLSDLPRTMTPPYDPDLYDADRQSSERVNQRNEEGVSPLVSTILKGNDIQKVRDLLRCKADLEMPHALVDFESLRSKHGLINDGMQHNCAATALYFAAQKGNIIIMRLLLDAGAKNNKPTCLHANDVDAFALMQQWINQGNQSLASARGNEQRTGELKVNDESSRRRNMYRSVSASTLSSGVQRKPIIKVPEYN